MNFWKFVISSYTLFYMIERESDKIREKKIKTHTLVGLKKKKLWYVFNHDIKVVRRKRSIMYTPTIPGEVWSTTLN